LAGKRQLSRPTAVIQSALKMERISQQENSAAHVDSKMGFK
jgi:hypothetical protein